MNNGNKYAARCKAPTLIFPFQKLKGSKIGRISYHVLLYKQRILSMNQYHACSVQTRRPDAALCPALNLRIASQPAARFAAIKCRETNTKPRADQLLPNYLVSATRRRAAKRCRCAAAATGAHATSEHGGLKYTRAKVRS